MSYGIDFIGLCIGLFVIVGFQVLLVYLAYKYLGFKDIKKRIKEVRK